MSKKKLTTGQIKNVETPEMGTVAAIQFYWHPNGPEHSFGVRWVVYPPEHVDGDSPALAGIMGCLAQFVHETDFADDCRRGIMQMQLDVLDRMNERLKQAAVPGGDAGAAGA